jgi:hypothetical protein
MPLDEKKEDDTIQGPKKGGCSNDSAKNTTR